MTAIKTSQNQQDRRREQFYLRYIRMKMWIDDPHCVYCGMETILPSHAKLQRGEPSPPNLATIDHKYSRYNPQRDIEKQEYFLCCFLCNNYKAQLEEDKVPIEELRERSRRPSHRTKHDAEKNSVLV